jgi:1-deoxy-D-xylulose-5-phosphate reductoisomerase
MILLGSTGSIGQNTLDIARRFELGVTALSAHSNTKLLNEQIRAFRPRYVAIADETKAHEVEHPNLFVGPQGILDMIEAAAADDRVLVNAIVGFAGLRPTLKAKDLSLKIALANKESLVAAGEFLSGADIVPIDSEHFGLWYLLGERTPRRLIITASGGAFRDTPLSSLKDATLDEALKHPNWKMGRKITCDSATMMNKLFELLEARWLFGVNDIDALIEPKSLVHALVEFADGSTTAHFANPDMRLPIAYALMGRVDEAILAPLDLIKMGSLEFREVDTARYPVWTLKDELLTHPHLGVVVNAANEAALRRFWAGSIGFTDIARCVLWAAEKFAHAHPQDIDDLFALDAEVRASFS